MMSNDTDSTELLGLMPVEFLCRLEWKECFLSFYLDMPVGETRTMIVQLNPRSGRKDRSIWLPVGQCGAVRDPHHIAGDPCGFEVAIDPEAPTRLENVLPMIDGPNQLVVGILELFEHMAHHRLAPNWNFYEMKIIFGLLDMLNVGHVEGFR